MQAPQSRYPGGPYGPPGFGGPPPNQGPPGNWGAPPPPPPPKNRTGLIIAAIVAAGAIVATVTIATVTLLGSGDGDSIAGPSTTASTSTGADAGGSSDESDVEAAAEKRVQLINDQDAVGLHDMACDADARTESTAGYEDLFDRNGSVSVTIEVQDVSVAGRVGRIEGVMSIDSETGDVNWAFKKEDGEWRFCPSLSERGSSTAPSTGGDDVVTG